VYCLSKIAGHTTYTRPVMLWDIVYRVLNWNDTTQREVTTIDFNFEGSILMYDSSLWRPR
jgi:hypothetical protein